MALKQEEEAENGSLDTMLQTQGGHELTEGPTAAQAEGGHRSRDTKHSMLDFCHPAAGVIYSEWSEIISWRRRYLKIRKDLCANSWSKSSMQKQRDKVMW